jgi:hypothetical protein
MHDARWKGSGRAFRGLDSRRERGTLESADTAPAHHFANASSGESP